MTWELLAGDGLVHLSGRNCEPACGKHGGLDQLVVSVNADLVTCSPCRRDDKRVTTELDDAIEQILGRYIYDAYDRMGARNEICGAIIAAGYDVYAQVPAPSDLRVLAASDEPMTTEE